MHGTLYIVPRTLHCICTRNFVQSTEINQREQIAATVLPFLGEPYRVFTEDVIDIFEDRVIVRCYVSTRGSLRLLDLDKFY